LRQITNYTLNEDFVSVSISYKTQPTVPVNVKVLFRFWKFSRTLYAIS